VQNGSLEIESDKPLVGETLFHCRNISSSRIFSEAMIMLPDKMYSRELIAPQVRLDSNGPENWYENYILLKNPDPIHSVNVTVAFYNENGSLVNPQPVPSPVSIASHANYCLDIGALFGWSGDFVKSATFEADRDITGHSEIVGVHPYTTPTPSPADIFVAGSELDSRYSESKRYFAPYCRSILSGSNLEETWLVIKNLEPASNQIILTLYDDDGTVKVSVGILADPGELCFHAFQSADLEVTSVEIESDYPLSGWVERSWVRATDYRDHWYDANLLQYW
jgi:hypothetical protein